ncbi:hypothetical protein FRC09_010181 [Ceratobasidium sp. 395]|nr:hypothetical protein FRC09_010181 [Ceratobasidium sp. 395]
MLDHLALVLVYVKTPMDVLRLGGRRKSGAGVVIGIGGKAEVDWVDAYSRAELEGEVSGAFKVLLAGPYAVAVGRMLLGLLDPREAKSPKEAGSGGVWETDRIVGVLSHAFSPWVESVVKAGAPVGAVLVETLGTVDDLVQEAAENEKAFGIGGGGWVVGEVVGVAMQLFEIYGQVGFFVGTKRILDIVAGSSADSPTINPVLQTLATVIRKVDLLTPIKPPLTTALFSQLVYLSDNSAVAIIRHHVSMSLVTPSTPSYLDNLLIQAFSVLLSPPTRSLSTNERTAHAPALFQSIYVMHDLLALLPPVRGDSLDADKEAIKERSRIIDGQSRCSYACLATLQWLDLDEEVKPLASLINRTPQNPNPTMLLPRPSQRESESATKSGKGSGIDETGP